MLVFVLGLVWLKLITELNWTLFSWFRPFEYTKDTRPFFDTSAMVYNAHDIIMWQKISQSDVKHNNKYIQWDVKK